MQARSNFDELEDRRSVAFGASGYSATSLSSSLSLITIRPLTGRLDVGSTQFQLTKVYSHVTRAWRLLTPGALASLNFFQSTEARTFYCLYCLYCLNFLNMAFSFFSSFLPFRQTPATKPNTALQPTPPFSRIMGIWALHSSLSRRHIQRLMPLPTRRI